MMLIAKPFRAATLLSTFRSSGGGRRRYCPRSAAMIPAVLSRLFG